MDICFSSLSIWIRCLIVCLSGICFLNLIRDLIVYFRTRIPPSPPSSKLNKSRKEREIRKKKKKKKTAADHGENKVATLDLSDVDVSELKYDTKNVSIGSVQKFSYESLVDATRNFTSDLLLYSDGLGEVYKGKMIDTKQVFAIRRLKHYTNLSLQEFENKVFILSQANHPNLAKLIGYSTRYEDKWLIYEHVPGKSFQDLFDGKQMNLDWKMRMKIVLGIAKALNYLQYIMEPAILDCYIEPSSIWLDKDGTPKLSSFGIASMFPSCKTMKYYKWAGEVAPEGDIYAVGILILMMLYGNKEFFHIDDGEMYKFGGWLREHLESCGNKAEMLDPTLQGKTDVDQLNEARIIAVSCLQTEPRWRVLAADLVKLLVRLAE